MVIAQYRGLFYTRDKVEVWNQEKRRQHRKAEEIGQPVFAAGAFTREEEKVDRGYYYDLLNSTKEKPAEFKQREVKEEVGSEGGVEDRQKKEKQGKNHNTIEELQKQLIKKAKEIQEEHDKVRKKEVKEKEKKEIQEYLQHVGNFTPSRMEGIKDYTDLISMLYASNYAGEKEIRRRVLKRWVGVQEEDVKEKKKNEKKKIERKRQVREGKLSQIPKVLEDIYTRFKTEDNIFVSTGDEPSHAIRYAYGEKEYSESRGKSMRARYSEEGKPRHKVVGKIYTTLHAPEEYGINGTAKSMIKKIASGEIFLNLCIRAERETQFIGYIPGDQVVNTTRAMYPDFTKEWKTTYSGLYGLGESEWNEVRKKFTEVARMEDQAEKEKSLVELELRVRDHVISQRVLRVRNDA